MAGDLHAQTATSDGRTLLFAEWGDRDGFPVFALHGTPGSRLLRHWDESKYVDVGARVITYDRPGYGGSDRCLCPICSKEVVSVRRGRHPFVDGDASRIRVAPDKRNVFADC